MGVTASTRVDIDAPVSVVWTVLADVDRYQEWNPLIREARGAPTVGGYIEMLICPPGLMRRRARVEVLVVEFEREFRWLGRWGLPRILDGNHAFRLEPIDASRTRVMQTERFSGLLAWPLAPQLVPKMTLGFEALDRALKTRCETLVRR